MTLEKRYPVCTLDAARTQALDVLRQPGAYKTRRQKAEDASNDPNTDVKTFNDFLEKRYEPWIVAHRRAGKATVQNIKAQFGKLFGKKPLSDVSAWAVERFRVDRLKDGVTAATVNRDLDRLRAPLAPGQAVAFYASMARVSDRHIEATS